MHTGEGWNGNKLKNTVNSEGWDGNGKVNDTNR